MFSKKGKRRAGPDNVRLRQEAEIRERRIVWYRNRLHVIGENNRTLKNRAEIAEGRLEAADELIRRQTKTLSQLNDRVAQLERELSDRTVEMPLPARPELVEAVA